MNNLVSFDRLKLTNNVLDDNGHVSNPLTNSKVAVAYRGED